MKRGNCRAAGKLFRVRIAQLGRHRSQPVALEKSYFVGENFQPRGTGRTAGNNLTSCTAKIHACECSACDVINCFQVLNLSFTSVLIFFFFIIVDKFCFLCTNPMPSQFFY